MIDQEAGDIRGQTVELANFVEYAAGSIVSAILLTWVRWKSSSSSRTWR